MKIRTEGKCIGCKERYTPGKGSVDLLNCEGVLQSLCSQKKLEEGYLVRISCAEEPNMYWIVIAVDLALFLSH